MWPLVARVTTDHIANRWSQMSRSVACRFGWVIFYYMTRSGFNKLFPLIVEFYFPFPIVVSRYMISNCKSLITNMLINRVSINDRNGRGGAEWFNFPIVPEPRSAIPLVN